MIDPEVKKYIDAQFTKLAKDLNGIRLGEDVVFTRSVRRRVLDDVVLAGVVDADLTDINTSTVVPGGGGTVDAATPYDARVIVDVDGTDYYLGLYEI
jgi:hypothetical protein